MTTRPRLLLAVQLVLVLAILGCVVLVAARHPGRLDLTPDGRFTLSPHSREVLARLQSDVRVTAFYSSQEGEIRREMADLLALYRDASPRITVRLLDLDRTPGEAERLGVGAYNVAVVESDGRRERLDPVSEDTLTTAFLKVAGTAPVIADWTSGHGELDPRDDEGRRGGGAAAQAMVADGFRVRVMPGAARIPDDAALIVVAGATRDLAPAEVDALEAHVRRGGHLMILAGPGTPASVGGLLRRFGIEPGDDVVVDEQARLFGTDGLSARVAYLNQALVPETPEVSAMLPVAQTLRLIDVDGVRGDYLAMTGETTWADVDRRQLDGGEAVFRADRDRHGPLPVATLVRVPAGEGREGRLLAIGDADFASNLHLNVLGNRDLLVAAAGLLARQDALVAARPRQVGPGTFSSLALTEREGRVVFLTAVVLPTIVFATVALVMARRRRLA